MDYPTSAASINKSHSVTLRDYNTMPVYSREFLLLAGKHILTLLRTYRISPSASPTIKDLKISSVIPTKGGSKGLKKENGSGVVKFAEIPVVISKIILLLKRLLESIQKISLSYHCTKRPM